MSTYTKLSIGDIVRNEQGNLLVCISGDQLIYLTSKVVTGYSRGSGVWVPARFTPTSEPIFNLFDTLAKLNNEGHFDGT